MKTLQDILDKRNLSALFQPIMDISGGTFFGFEGLIRGPANSPLHSPINLFAAAKQQGLSLEIEMLCRQIVLESFAAQNLPGNLFLNISPDALAHPSFKDGQTLTYLKGLGIDPQRVIIEITENQPTFDFEGMRNALLHYRGMGFQIAIDDFGTGYSSLSYLKQLPLNQLKIDQSFVRDIATDPSDAIMVQTIIDMANNFRFNVIAEGVETEAQLAFLKLHGCRFYQGYLFSKPVPVEEFETLLKRSCVGKENV